MAQRPKVFELAEIEAELLALGVPQQSVGPTISFMRLVIPLVVRKAGVDGIVEAVEQAAREWDLTDNMGWAKGMAPHIVEWATTVIEKYKAGST